VAHGTAGAAFATGLPKPDANASFASFDRVDP